MLVHLGGEVVVDAREVVAILDARCLRGTRELLRPKVRGRRARSRSHPVGLDADQGWGSARSLVVTTNGLHPAPISPVAAARRIARVHTFRGLQKG